MKISTVLKKLTVMLVTFAMLVSMVPSVFADVSTDFVDFPTGWSKEAMTAAVNNGLLNGYTNNEIGPRANLTRAELATIVTRAFGATVKADISAYTDASKSAWYYDSIAKAVQMGILKGFSSTTMAPDNSITREEVFTAVARALVLSSDDHSSLSRFKDSDMISDYAKSHIACLASKGYVNGDDWGNLNPKARITREEFAQFMHNMIKRYITKPGIYTDDMTGMVVVRVGGVTLKNLTVNNDLVIGDGVGFDEIKLDNISINGRFLARAGTITVKNSKLTEKVVVNNPNGTTYFNNTDSEKFFAGYVENTEAQFLTPGSVNVGSGGGVTPPPPSTENIQVIFMLDASTVYLDNIYVEEGTQIGALMPKDPSKLGYTFEGWLNKNGTYFTPTSYVNAPGPAVVTADWKIINYPVTYLDDKGNSFGYFVNGYTAPKTFNINSPLTVPAKDKVSRIGYKFNGWKDENGQFVTSVKVTETTPLKGIKLTADFDLITYKVTYKDVEFKDGYTPVTSYNVEGVIPTLPTNDNLKETSIPAGQKLIGWKDQNGNRVLNLEITEGMDESRELYPVFADKDKDIEVIFILEYDFLASEVYADQIMVMDGSTIGSQMPAEPDELGYTFGGWYYYDSHGFGKDFTSSTVINYSDCFENKFYVMADMTAIKYPISYIDKNTNLPFGAFENEPARYYSVYMDWFQLPMVMYEVGYTFSGWQDKDGNPAKIVVTPTTTEFIFYGYYKPNTYSITYHNVTFKPGVNPVKSYTMGTPSPALPTADDLTEDSIPVGQKLSGWTDGGSFLGFVGNFFINPLTERIDLYPVFVDKDAIQVIFKFADGSVYKDNITVTDGTPIGPKMPSDPKIVGYKFNGWKDKKGSAFTSSSVINGPGPVEVIADMDLITYKVNYNDIEFVDGYTPVTSYTVEDPTPALPTKDQIKESSIPAGKKFAYWKDAKGNRIANLNIYAETEENREIYPHYIDGDEIEVRFELKDGKLYETAKVIDGLIIGADKMPEDPDVLGYKFNGWVDENGNAFTSGNIIKGPGPVIVVADLELRKYDIKYYDEDGNAFNYFKENHTPEPKFDIETPYELPDSDDIERLGYEFDGWVDENGDSVTSVEVTKDTPLTGLKLYSDFTAKTYTVTYKDVSFKPGEEPVTSYTIEDTVPALPEETALTDESIPDRKYLAYWKDGEGTKVTTLEITDETPLSIVLYPHFEDTNEIYVKFYKGYGQYQKLMETKGANGTAENPAYVVPPEITISKIGYSEKESIASVYKDNEYIHYIKPSFWYVDDTGAFAPFDETTPVTKDTDVHLLYRTFSVSLDFASNDESVGIFASYEDDTRLMDSFKDFANNGRNQINMAIKFDKIPNYEDTLQAVINKLASKGIIDEDKNIKVIPINVPISTLIKESTANDMIKQFVRDTVADASKLNTILTVVDFDTLASQIDIGDMVEKMTDAEIAELIKDETYKGTIASVMITDLKSEESKLLPTVIEFIKRDNTFRASIVDDVVADLADVIVESELKTAAIGHIKSILGAENDTTGMQDKFVQMMIDSLSAADTDPLKQFVVDKVRNDSTIQGIVVNTLIGQLEDGTASDEIINLIKTNEEITNIIIDEISSGSSTLMPTVVAKVKDLLLDETNGAALRKTILTSSMLESILNDSLMKPTILDLLIDDTFIDKVLGNPDFKAEFVTLVSEDEDFIDALIDCSLFRDELVDQLHHASLADDIKDLLTNNSAYKESLIDAVLADDGFKDAIDEGGSIHDFVLDAIKFTDYVADEEDLLKYVFNQSGVTGTYDFVKVADIETMFADIYADMYVAEPDVMNTRYGASSYDQLTDDNKQLFKNDLYADDSVKTEALNKIAKIFDEYKTELVKKVADGEAITDTSVKSTIETLVVNYVVEYIDEDSSLDPTVASLIEEILISNVVDILRDDAITSTDPLYQLKTDIEEMKETLINNNTVIKNITSTKGDLVKTVLGKDAYYGRLIAKLSTMVKAESSTVYADIEGKVVEALSGTTVDSYISTFIQNNVNNTDINNTIKGYISELDNSTMAGYIQTYLTIPANKSTAEGQILTHIKTASDSELSGYLKVAANSNRSTFESVLITTIGSMSNAQLAQYIAQFLNVPVDNNSTLSNKDIVKQQIDLFLKSEEQADAVEGLAKTYIKESDITNDILAFIDGIDEEFVEENRSLMLSVLDKVDLSSLVDEEFVKTYISKLDDNGKKNFADTIYNVFSNTTIYKDFMYDLMHEDYLVVTKDNKSMLQVVSSAIRNLDYDAVMAQTNNSAIDKIIDIVGESLFRKYFDETKKEYSDGLDKVLAEIGVTKEEDTYKTKLTIKVDIINDIVKPMYDKALPKVIDKLSSKNVGYYENTYLQYLVEDDIISALLNGDSSLATDDLTGYSIKDIMDYYDYLYKLLLVGDDALCWYGENISADVIDAYYEALVGKTLIVRDKLNGILEAFAEEGTLPAQLQKVVDSVQQIDALLAKFEGYINTVINKYLNHEISSVDPSGNEKVRKVIDLLIGTEEPVITIDTVYSVFYNYDEKVRGKIQELIDSGKLKAAVDKFESSSIGKLFIGKNDKIDNAYNSIYDLFIDLVEDGIEKFRIEKDILTTVDAYSATVGDVTITVKRYYQN